MPGSDKDGYVPAAHAELVLNPECRHQPERVIIEANICPLDAAVFAGVEQEAAFLETG